MQKEFSDIVDEQTIVYIGITSLIAVLVLVNSSSFGNFGIIAVVLSILTIIIIFVINYADFIVFPLITSVLGVKIVPAKGYYMPKSSNSVVKYVNGIYYATGYLTANIFNYVFFAENVDEQENEKMGEAPDKWERIVMNTGFPFKVNVISIAEDVQKFRDELEGKRGMLEFNLSNEMNASNPSQLTIEDLQRKMNILDARINRLSGGERPIDAVMYIETTSVGVSEKEAMDSLSNQLSHLQTAFNAFDLNITRVIGRELYYLFTLNYAMPEREKLSQIFGEQK